VSVHSESIYTGLLHCSLSSAARAPVKHSGARFFFVCRQRRAESVRSSGIHLYRSPSLLFLPRGVLQRGPGACKLSGARFFFVCPQRRETILNSQRSFAYQPRAIQCQTQEQFNARFGKVAGGRLSTRIERSSERPTVRRGTTRLKDTTEEVRIRDIRILEYKK